MARILYYGLLALLPVVSFAQEVTPDVPSILERNRSALGLDEQKTPEYRISNAYKTAHLGVTHIYLEQRHSDIPVYNGILNLNMLEDKMVSFGNRWIKDLETRAPSAQPAITSRVATERAAAHLGKAFVAGTEQNRSQNSLGQDVRVVFAPGTLSREDIPVELYWVSEAKAIHLCWMVEIEETDAENIWRVFIDAHTGEFVRKDNLVSHCSFEKPTHAHCMTSTGNQSSTLFVAPDSSYNVFPMPIESPNHGTRSVQVRPWLNAGAGNNATTLGWHNTGTTQYTITRGNNVHAYEDINDNNSPGFNPDTANLRFDYPFIPTLDPEDNMAAAITNLFYWNNIIHDVTYQYGFDEVSGNFQVNNLSRGGNGGDDVRAEALDGGGTNNANFSTPSDGNRPRMQMYLWSEVSESSPLTINSPETISGDMYAVESAFSSQNGLDNVGPVSGDLVLVEDTDGDTHLACGSIDNGGSLSGKVAVIDRGDCNFTVKVKAVQDLGAIAAIVINNVAGSPFGMGGTDNTITIPAVMVSLPDGNLLKTTMESGTVNITLDAVEGIIPDGDYDSGIITHEYGHGISIRLTGGPSNVGCLNNAEQMGEGWSDFFGLMLTTDWSNAQESDLRGIGTYVLGESTDGTGIRTYPYTTDLSENPFTYASITNSGGSVHYIGSVWCTMLWDMTWKIIETAGTDPDIYHGTGGNNIALQLVIDALKLQPCSPGFVDGRDALLLADELRYGGQYSCAIWDAFARRGLGMNASQGSSNSYTDGTTSFVSPNVISLESTPDPSEAHEGEIVTFTLKATAGCEDKTDIVIADVLSEDLEYIPGSGGVLNGDRVEFFADELTALDTLTFSYSARVRPCITSESVVISEDDAEGPDQYETIKLGGFGTKQWVKSTALSVSMPNSWYARDYTSYGDFALTLMDPLSTNGPVEISFDHRYETEATYDGGVIEYSLNGGTTWIDAGPDFIENGYPATITTTGTDSPLIGRDAFTGDSDDQFGITGFVHSTIQLNLGGSQSLLVRFRFASDGGVGGPGINGWYVDNIEIRQGSGITNQTRITSEDILQDSLYYGITSSGYAGTILYVDPTASGDEDGHSWTHAMTDLAYALRIAGCGEADTICVAQGYYLPGSTNDRELSFTIPENTALFGGFPSAGSTFAERDPDIYSTTLSGDIGTPNTNSDDVYHVVQIDSAVQNVLLDGMHITSGNANGTGLQSQGAGLLCQGEATLRTVRINKSHGLTDGQIILVRNAIAHLILHDCTIFGTDDSFAKLLNTEAGHVTISGNTQFLQE